MSDHMQIEFLGTGGAISIPRPGCLCEVCEEARQKGSPYSRSGPSLFVHGPNILIDTPEEIKDQLNRANISHISACFYSHWHPDHVMGRRVWEMNMDWRNWPPQHKNTDIYLPERVARDFKEFLGSWEHLDFFQSKGIISINVLPNGKSVTFQEIEITPFPLAEEYVYAFIFQGHDKRVLIAPDELVGWKPDKSLGHFDLVIVPMGIANLNPLSGETNIPSDHPVLNLEATFEETLTILEGVHADRIIMTHIEEPDQLSYDDFLELEAILTKQGRNIKFAYDGMIIDV